MSTSISYKIPTKVLKLSALKPTSHKNCQKIKNSNKTKYSLEKNLTQKELKSKNYNKFIKYFLSGKVTVRENKNPKKV